MFQTARLTLTAWYLLIIMTISISFSVVIYKMLGIEVERFSRQQRFRIERRINPDATFHLEPLDEELIAIAQKRILFSLISINSLIFLSASVLGYILAGRTLHPIEEMVDEQNRFISDASHELRTPLTALKASLEVHLRDPHLTLSQAKTLLKNNVQDVNALQTLSESLLTLANFERTNDIPMQSCDVKLLIQNAVRKMTPLAKQKNITIRTDARTTFVRLSESHITDALLILLDNAIKYSNAGGLITLSVQKTTTRVCIKVTDNGIGIASDEIPHIFDRFYRSDTSRNSKGFGLGLAIANKIVDAHHGTIEVKSIPGKGSIFTVTIPS